ncbi:LCP family protein [Actinomadura algeriensis]|uniref:Anionic cell wall polymer biosynthesis LytR-Cps2A-Psr (LCP) family protein n=1 Tax=Actinomadura algeriensis TaxID=1679523 RepID=A0ABR9JZ49_9ACTN|nr:LCP family protein [Actinomadura algeriensis]MBE1535856.1 anionic cell wall polymer biosynthesis LytR-Cps2A-Psr (LCP) family protein [Actinomadura algeriensis]
MGGWASRRARRPDGDGSPRGSGGLPRALALTLASALVWGVAHIVTGRRRFGGLLLALYTVLAAAVAAAATVYRGDLLNLIVRPDVLQQITGGLVVLGVLWVAIVVRSYQLLRPEGMRLSGRTLGAAAVALMCFGVAVPTAWAVRGTYVYRDALTSIFQAGGSDGQKIDADDPWDGEERVNILLLGGDAAENRPGVRTDSMTLASVDTATGDTVLLSLPRNLESFPMPPGPARDRFPYGFTGDGALNPGLLNEVYQYAEEHPDVVPGVPKGERGPTLLKATISGILGMPVDYYILVDMFGFADIIDAMGGVKINILQPIPYGQQGDVLQAGHRTLTGKEALWYGRSRTNSSDYVRMGRQKCLMAAIAEQADPRTVLTKFDALASAAKQTLSTDIPQELLPALIELSGEVKEDARIDSLQFVPPLIHTGNPDFEKIRRLAAEAIGAADEAAASGSPAPPASPTRTPSGAVTVDPPVQAQGSPSPGTTPTSQAPQTEPVSLEASCP